MKLTRVIAILLILAGALVLAYRGFDITRDSKSLQLGPLELKMQQKERVELPLWLGFGAIAAGVLLLVIRRR